MSIISSKHRKFFLRAAAVLLILLAASMQGEERNTYHRQWSTLEKEGRFTEAVVIYKQAVREYPEEAWFYVFIGHSLKMQKKADEALPYFESARKYAAGDAGVLRNVYYGYCAYGSFLGFEKKKWEEAAEWYNKAALLDPKPAFAHNVMGNALRNAGKLEKAYAAFLAAYNADPDHVNGDLKANFRTGMIEGMRQRGSGEKDLLCKYSELAAIAYPADSEIILAAVSGTLSAGRADKAREIADKVTSHPLQELVRGQIELSGGMNDQKVFAHFDAMSREAPRDYELDDAIAKIYRSMVDALSYPEQMASPYQDRAVDFNTRAVQKYFLVHPYTQTLTLRPPLQGRFFQGQGAGGRSFHNGLEAHYSYDLRQEMGAAIYAVADGEVIDAESSHADNPVGSPVNLNARANFVRLRHAGGITSTCVHLKRGSVAVKTGQRVKAGQKLGEMGNSGVSGGVHLHFEMANEKKITIEPRFTGLKGKRERDAAFLPMDTFGSEKFTFEYYP